MSKNTVASPLLAPPPIPRPAITDVISPVPPPAPNPASAAERDTSVSKSVILEVVIGSIWSELDTRPLGTLIRLLKSLVPPPVPNPLAAADAEIYVSSIIDST